MVQTTSPPIFHQLEGGKMVTAPDDPAGERTIDVIVDAMARAQHSQ
jgi:hypothetical protein